jgi:membrane-associated HD superfamily phosphohydrolase
MKMLCVVGAVLFLASQFLCQVYAIELCEPRDYYNLADSTKCKTEYNKAGNKNESRELMFEILKTYPYEKKDRFIKVLQRKIELVDNYITQQQGQGQTEKAMANISKLEQTKQGLSEQLGMVNTATQDNWVSVRDQARKVLEEAAQRLREVE